MPIELTELASALDWQDRIHRGTMLGGSQGWMLAAGVLAVEGGRVSEALAILSAVAALPNPHYQSWAHFFLGLLRQTQARQRVVSDAARESGTVPTSDFTRLTAAFQSYQRSIALARHPHSSSALWARSNAAALAMEFRDDRCAMQLLLPTAKLADQDWEGIAFRMSSGLADGKLHMISMLNTLLKTFLDLSDVESAIPLALKYVAVSGHEASLLALNYSDVLPRDRLAELHHEWGRKMRDHIGPVTRPIPADRGLHRRLKIGYVSSDLKRHPCAYFLEPFLRHHDREAVHVTVYQCNPGGDEYSRKLRGLADEWIEVSHEPERVIAERLRKDTIDIAVELSGHAVVRPFNRSPCHVLAHYAAPVQVSWIGYCNTTGLDCIHYRFVDAVTDHPNTKQWHSERLWRLPDCFLSFAPPQDLLDTPISPLPCIANGLVSFGTFNNLAKICASTMRLWGRLLARLPTAQLKIKGMKGRPIVDEMGNATMETTQQAWSLHVSLCSDPRDSSRQRSLREGRPCTSEGQSALALERFRQDVELPEAVASSLRLELNLLLLHDIDLAQPPAGTVLRRNVVANRLLRFFLLRRQVSGQVRIWGSARCLVSPPLGSHLPSPLLLWRLCLGKEIPC